MTTFTRPENVICILGMHRSGTSALTGSLQNSGLALGQHHVWNPHNLKGNRENQDIVDLHDDILSFNNGSWDHPPSKVRFCDTHTQRLKSILSEHSEEAIWGFKDPRSLLTISLWEQAIPDLKKIGIFRHPASVASSLYNRGKFPIDDGLELWYRYNKILYSNLKQRPFPLICFDWNQDKFHHKVNIAATQLGLQTIMADNHFYTSDLLHHTHQNTNELPWKIRRLYKKLLKFTESN